MSDLRGKRMAIAMRARRINKLTVLATAVGVSESAVSRWCGNGAMTLGNVESVCRYLDISADWLLFGHGCMDQHKHAAQVLPELADLAAAMEALTPGAKDQLLLFLQALSSRA